MKIAKYIELLADKAKKQQLTELELGIMGLWNKSNSLKQQKDELLKALKPFANFACDDWETHKCMNCIAKQVIAKAQE